MALLKTFVAKSPTIWLSVGVFYLAMQCLCFITAISSFADEPITGEFLYKKKCSACHPDAKKITVHKGIIELMRNPPPYMPAFIEDRISDKDAERIENYILLILKRQDEVLIR